MPTHEKLNELKTNLSAELSEINGILRSNQVLTVNGTKFLVTYIAPVAIDECSKSGLFSPLNEEALLHLSRLVKLYNVEVEYLFSLLTNIGNPNIAKLLANCHDNMEKDRLLMLDNINQISRQLNLKFSKSINLNEDKSLSHSGL